MSSSSSNPVELLLLASSWYGANPDAQLGPSAKIAYIGNEFYGTGADGEPATDRSAFLELPSEATLAKLRAALDDLRRLGEADLREPVQGTPFPRLKSVKFVKSVASI